MNKCINFLHDLGFTTDKRNCMAIEIGFKQGFRKLNGLDYVLAPMLKVTKEVVSFNTIASTFLGDVKGNMEF
jgi:hypothetical protein